MLAENHATPEQMEKVASNISLWGEIDFEEKRHVGEYTQNVIREMLIKNKPLTEK